jgi:predicted DNA-binding WGR domain protein
MIRLTRSDPSRNMHRFYALQVSPTLFDEWALIAEWGRIGSPGKVSFPWPPY